MSNPTREFLDIGDALSALRDGRRVKRSVWPTDRHLAITQCEDGRDYVRLIERDCESCWEISTHDLKARDWYVL